MSPPTSQTGAAGEFFVAAQLSQRGWAAGVLLGGVPRTDILAQHLDRHVTIAVQSKASNGGGDFQAGAKTDVPGTREKHEWMICVGLGEPGTMPAFYVVPRNAMSAFVWAGHQEWLSETRRDGRPRQDNSMRNVRQSALAEYRDRWDDLFELPDDLPYRFTGAFWSWISKVGLPPDHPGVVLREDIDDPTSGVPVPDDLLRSSRR